MRSVYSPCCQKDTHWVLKCFKSEQVNKIWKYREFLNKTLTFQFRCLLPVEAIEPCSALSVLRCWITMGLVCGWTKSKLIEKSCCDLNLRFLLRGRDFIKGNLPFTLHKAPGISTILINIERLGCCLLSPGQGWSAASGGLSPLATAAAHSSSRSRSRWDRRQCYGPRPWQLDTYNLRRKCYLKKLWCWGYWETWDLGTRIHPHLLATHGPLQTRE